MDKKVAIATCAVFAIGAGMLVPSIAGAQAETAFEDGYTHKKFSIEDCKPATYPWQELGYVSIYDYGEDLACKQLEACGMAEEAIAAYENVITEEQKWLLVDYESDMINAQTIASYNESMDAFNGIVEELETAMKESIASQRESVKGFHQTENFQMENSPVYSSTNGLTKSGGVNWHNGRKETWYSQRVLPGGGLNIPGRYVASDGTIRDADGYIVVAASDLPYGSVVNTSLGSGKVYDTGCAPGVTDIYTDW